MPQRTWNAADGVGGRITGHVIEIVNDVVAKERSRLCIVRVTLGPLGAKGKKKVRHAVDELKDQAGKF